MTQAIPFAPAVRFAALINLLWRAVGWCSNGSLPGAVIRLITRRFYRSRIRFASLAARFAAGTLRPYTPRKPGTRTTKPAPPPRDPMPRHSGWLVEMVPAAAAGRGDLHRLLNTPELAAFIAAAPQAASLLRPLCRMLGVPIPPLLHLPPRARPAKPARKTASARRRPKTTTPPKPRPPSHFQTQRPKPQAAGPPEDDA